jgi:hypothetical protein
LEIGEEGRRKVNALRGPEALPVMLEKRELGEFTMAYASF